MNYKVILKPTAELEIAEACEWYASKNENLGSDLLCKIEDEINRLSQNPYQFQKRYRSVRIVFTKRFPYGIHYTIEDKKVFVHAFLHTSRNPRS